MQTKLSLYRPDGTSEAIAVTVDPTAKVRDVATRIAAADPRRQYSAERDHTLQVSSPVDGVWRLLPPDAVIGDEWLASGASVGLVDLLDAAEPLAQLASATRATLHIRTPGQRDREIRLPRGSHVVGRDQDSDIVVSDRYMSKRHLRLDISRTVEVVDLGAANGVEIDGTLMSRARVDDTLTLLAGGTEIRIDVQADAAGSSVPLGAVPFNRSPRVEDRYIGREFTVPDVPREADPPPFPLLAMIAPVMLGGAMFAMTQRPITLLFVLMSPIMMIGTYLTTKRREKTRLSRGIAEFDEGLADLGQRLEAEKTDEQRIRQTELPPTADVLRAAQQLDPLLWTRRPEHWSFLAFRAGAADLPTRNTVETNPGADLLAAYQERLDQMLDRHRLVLDVPIVVQVVESGAVGIAGRADTVADVVASTVAQLTGTHSPAELVVAAALTPEWARRLDWLKWLPHTMSPHSPIGATQLAATQPAVASLLDSLDALVSAREQDRTRRTDKRGAITMEKSSVQGGATVGEDRGARDAGYDGSVPAIIVLMADGAARDRARMVSIAERGADVGVFPIWLSERRSSLPAVCRSFIDTTPLDEGGKAIVGLVRVGEELEANYLELVDPARAYGFSRNLSRITDANVPVDDVSDLPRSVALVNLIDTALLDEPGAAIERWQANESISDRSGGEPKRRRRAGRLRATVGATAGAAMHLDLRAQGPHALVGGTTGAGKSEFLQAWVLGMASEYSPDRLTFLFVDYKGGSAFAECVKLPHTVGLVTDLTPHLVRRALTSLRAELHHREELLNRKSAKDLLELEKRGDPDAPPALVLIIDEFAALVGEVPEFVDGVVDIAQRGRSLGIHLIMATQRPAGVIRDNLRANTNLRIALRMADESDSNDVIGIRDAAHFDPGLPGRGIAKTGPGRLERFQSGYAGGWASEGPAEASVDVASLPFAMGEQWIVPGADDAPVERELGPTDQARMVVVITEAAKRAAIPEPRRPWLDELPSAIDLAQLRSRTDAALPIGVADLPERQAQHVMSYLPDSDGHMVVFGTGGTGKTVALRAVAASAALAEDSEVHVYGMDFGTGALRALTVLPIVGDIVPGDDSERVIRLLKMLRGELDRRSREYSELQAANITDVRRLPGRDREPRIILLIDNYPGFREAWEIPTGRTEWYRVFMDIIALGRPLGIHVVMSADRPNAVPGAVAAGVQRRVVLRLADDTGYTQFDLPKDVITETSPPGRALFGSNETQIAVLGGDSATTAQTDALAALAEQLRTRGATEVPGIPALPTEVMLSDLADTGERLAIGISEDTLGPFLLEPAGAFVISGPPGSGRSNALGVIADRVLRRPFKAYYLGPRRSLIASDERWTRAAFSAEDAIEMIQEIKALATGDVASRIAFIVESVGDFLQSPAESAIVDLVKLLKREEHFVVAEAESSSWVSSWPLFGEFKSARRGLLLQPDSMDGEIVLKTALPRTKRSEYPEGRGMVVERGKAQRVQIALVRADAG